MENANTEGQVPSPASQAAAAPIAAPAAAAPTAPSTIITIDEFKKAEMRIGTIVSAERIEGADKLLKLAVDFGEKSGPRQILSGIAEYYAPETLVGKQCPFATNLAPRTLRGLASNGMIIAGSDADGVVLLHPSRPVPNGTKLS